MITAKKVRRFFLLIVAVLAICIAIASFTKIHNFFGINRAETQEKVIALSYDDGPKPPYTNQLIALLDRYQIQATFFTIGKNIEQYPELVRLAIAKGEELGNHSYSHKDMLFKSPDFLLSELEKTDALLRQLGVTENINFRPPWGRRLLMLPYLVSKLHKNLIMWDIDSEDYRQDLTPEAIANRVIEQVRPGSIIVMHDGGGDRSRTVAATEIIIKTLTSKGYQFKTVSELLTLDK